MCPQLFSIGPFTIYGYGVMLALAFASAYIVTNKEFKFRKIQSDISPDFILISVIAGLVGAKLLSAFENFELLIDDPIGTIFNPKGLTFYGGLILATVANWWYAKKKSIPPLKVADSAAPAVAIAYGVGRVGCHLAGDGCYGLPTGLPWGVNYTKGVVSTLSSKNSQLVELFKTIFPGKEVPIDIAVHPTPIYELSYSILIFIFLIVLSRKVKLNDGCLFGIFLVVLGVCRFTVEFIRLNEKILFGLTEAQLISIGMIVGGAIFFFYHNKKGSIARIGKQKT